MLTPEKIAEFKKRLLEEKENLEKELGKISNKTNSEEYTTKVELMDERDEEANADEVEEYTTDLAITERLEKKLGEVKSALERIENGTYGKCESCPDGEIPLERLEAYPSANSCIKKENKN